MENNDLTRRSLLASLAAVAVAPALPRLPSIESSGLVLATGARRTWGVYDSSFLGRRVVSYHGNLYRLVEGPTA